MPEGQKWHAGQSRRIPQAATGSLCGPHPSTTQNRGLVCRGEIDFNTLLNVGYVKLKRCQSLPI